MLTSKSSLALGCTPVWKTTVNRRRAVQDFHVSPLGIIEDTVGSFLKTPRTVTALSFQGVDGDTNGAPNYAGRLVSWKAIRLIVVFPVWDVLSRTYISIYQFHDF